MSAIGHQAVSDMINQSRTGYSACYSKYPLDKWRVI